LRGVHDPSGRTRIVVDVDELTKFDFKEAEEDLNQLEIITKGSKSSKFVEEARQLFVRIKIRYGGEEKKAYFARIRESFEGMKWGNYFIFT